MTKHYHVLTGLQGGYLPNSQYAVETYEEAITASANDAEAFNADIPHDELDADEFTGGDGFWANGRELIEVSECNEPECYDDNGQLRDE